MNARRILAVGALVATLAVPALASAQCSPAPRQAYYPALDTSSTRQATALMTPGSRGSDMSGSG